MNRTRDILRKHLIRSIFISMLAILLLRTTGTNAALAMSCGQWNIAQSPGTSTMGISLSGVAALSATDVWAVGYFLNSNIIDQTLIEHWDGTQWSIVSSPNVASVSNTLYAVAAVSADDVWAVGGTFDSHSGKGQTLVEHWDGTQWSIVASPNPPQAVDSLFRGVAAVSANDVWAVGGFFPGQGQSPTLIEHWDGTQWSIISSPNVNGAATNFLKGVSALSSTNIWATGFYDQHFNSKDRTLIEHWDGTQWSIIKSPNIPSNTNDLNGIAAISSKEVWAVGSYQHDINSSLQTLIERWNGKKWRIVTSPNPSTDAELWAVAGVSNNDVWAVGYSVQGPGSSFFEHWDGTQWNIVPGPNPPQAIGSFLDGIAASSANNVWAVGDYFSHTDNLYHTLTEFYC